MKKLINVFLFLLPFVIGFRGVFTDNNFMIEIGLILLIYIYSFGVTDADREVGLATIDLPLWAKRILFPNKPNPFRGKTIIFQTCWIISSIVMMTTKRLFPHIGMIVFYTHLGFMLLLVGRWCDMMTKKKSQIKRGLRPDPKKSIEDGDPCSKWWDDNKCR